MIHCCPQIDWQGPAAERMARGLKAIGVPVKVSHKGIREEGSLPILLGTTRWRALEQPPYLLVDRCSFGDTNQWVSLVRDGHGRRGDHSVPEGVPGDRWERIGVPVQPWRSGSRVVLCGQHEPYTPRFERLDDWYRTVSATHFRRHPHGDNPTGLPETRSWDDVGLAVTLNSSVAVDALLAGVPTRVDDEGSMAWPGFQSGDDRLPWLHWLAWTQFHWNEIAEGKPWEHLLET